MRVALIQFPGATCARESRLALEQVGLSVLDWLWYQPIERLADCEAFVIVGGFSYEDRLRPGLMAAQTPVIRLLKQQDRLAKPILGICNGAQILVEAGLVPGYAGYTLGMALAANRPKIGGRQQPLGFYNAEVQLRRHPKAGNNLFCQALPLYRPLSMPVAHASGRFLVPAGLEALKILQYCDAEGIALEDFPVNPNGSTDNIAAIGNFRGNVLAMMPHPERSADGLWLFQGLKQHLLGRTPGLASYQRPANGSEVLLQPRIPDQQAQSLKSLLAARGIRLEPKVYRHFEWLGASLEPSKLYYNPNKEAGLTTLPDPAPSILIRDSAAAANTAGWLESKLWQFRCQAEDRCFIEKWLDEILESHLLFNPFSEQAYRY